MALQDALSLELENWMAPILGLGVFCQWFGLLRFFSYFESFNVSAWMDGEKWELREGSRRAIEAEWHEGERRKWDVEEGGDMQKGR